jgi:putative oxidoreductase
MNSAQDILLVVGRIALGIPFIAEGLRQVAAWPGVVGLFRHSGGPYPFGLALLTVAANLVAPVLVMLGIRARLAALILATVTAVGLYLLHRVNIDGLEFQRSIAIIGGLLLVGAVGPGRHAMEPGH